MSIKLNTLVIVVYPTFKWTRLVFLIRIGQTKSATFLMNSICFDELMLTDENRNQTYLISTRCCTVAIHLSRMPNVVVRIDSCAHQQIYIIVRVRKAAVKNAVGCLGFTRCTPLAKKYIKQTHVDSFGTIHCFYGTP